MTFTAGGRITQVLAGCKVELSPGSSQDLQAAEGALNGNMQHGSWQNNAEEEEAFLEAATRQQPSQPSGDLLLKCRWAGAGDWACWHVLTEGTLCTTGDSHPLMPCRQTPKILHGRACQRKNRQGIRDPICMATCEGASTTIMSSLRLLAAGGMSLVTSRRGPTLHVLVSSASDSSGASPGSTALQGKAVSQSQDTMRLEVACKCLQVSLWDDERRIILGPPESGAPSTMADREALCLYVDALVASAVLSQPQGKSRSASACPTQSCLKRAMLHRVLPDDLACIC